MEKRETETKQATNKEINIAETPQGHVSAVDINMDFKICPTCLSKSLKIENGCDICLECGYSKCDK